MSALDPNYIATLQGVGFKPVLVSIADPQANNWIDIAGMDSNQGSLATLLHDTANFVRNYGSGGLWPFVCTPYSGPGQQTVVTVDGLPITDTQLIALLDDASLYVQTAGARVQGLPFEDVETAFERINLGDFLTIQNRT